MNYVNSKILAVAGTKGLIPRDKNQGIWLSALLPLCVIISGIKHPLEATQNYRLLTTVSIGLLLSAVLFIFRCYRRTSTNLLKVGAGVLTTLHLLGNGNGNIFLITGLSLVILCYDHLLLLIMKECPNTFTFGEASVTLQSIILFVSATILNTCNSLTQHPMSDINIATSIIQMGLLTLCVLGVLSYKIKCFRKPIPFYSLLAFLMFLFLVVVLYGIIRQSAFVWIYYLLSDSNRRLYLMVYWSCSVLLATLAIKFQINRAKKATTTSRKIFHILAVIVYIPGLLYECTILYLASGVVFGVLLFIELVRVLNIPPFGNHLQDIFVVYCDEKDSGVFALTQLYLLVGCSLPIWLHPALCDVTDAAGVYMLPLLSGLFTIGVGDTAASALGVTFGRHKWPGGKKTVEGTLACIFTQCILLLTLYYFGFLVGVKRLQLYQAISAILATSLVEAKTSQVDNLVLPLIMYIILIL